MGGGTGSDYRGARTCRGPLVKMNGGRKSRRLSMLDPVILPSSEPPQGREMKALMNKGGSRGRINPKHSDWVFFPREKRRTPSMISVSNLKKDIKEIKQYTTKDDDDITFGSKYCLLHVDQLQSMADYACESCDEMKQKKRSKIKIKTNGMASSINLYCTNCNDETYIPAAPSTFKGKGFDGEPTRRENNAWFDLNLRLVLGTLAVGNGGTDLSDFAAMLDLPQSSSFGKRPFNRIECVVGEVLRQVAEESMKRELEKEIELTLEENGQSYHIWKQQASNNKPQVILTISFDMGWQKRSSGHKFDSLSGHKFVIGARSKKIYIA